MKDQVDSLKRRGIAADCMDSSKSWEEMQLIHLALRKGQLRLLYCAPERLNNEGFISTVMNIPGGIRLVAVDEAHCISEWGHAFRPDYLKVARFVEEISAKSVICLTATATPRVAEDVCKAFKIKESCVFRTSPYRPNLQLLAQAIHSTDENAKWDALFHFLRTHAGSTLIYVALQEQAETHAKVLIGKGFNAAAFHAGMKLEDKTRIQNAFMASSIPIVRLHHSLANLDFIARKFSFAVRNLPNAHQVCATIAFGMGIDKADIRNIVHWDSSSTVEEYSQQIGRAGRDGKTSHCLYYISHGSFYMREVFARGDLPSSASLKLLLKAIFDGGAELGVDGVLKISHLEQSKAFDIRASPLTIIFAMLELHHGLIRAITPEYSKYTFEARPSYYAVLKTDQSPEAKAIWSSAVKKAKLHHIDVAQAARERGLTRGALVGKLNKLDGQGHLQLKASGVVHRYRILKALPRSESQLDELVATLYAQLETRENDGLRRAREIMGLITGSKCFALALAEHFGMGLPSGKTSCGHCTYCMTGKPVVAPSRSPLPTTPQSIKPVLDAIKFRDDPRFLARVAFGIKSPRVTELKLDKSDVYRSLASHDFDVSPLRHPQPLIQLVTPEMHL